MANIKLPSVAWNEGSLLKRTLLHVLAFVIGSAGFVALSSMLLLWVAKSVLPTRHAPDAEADTDKGAELTPALSKGKNPAPTVKAKRGKAAEPAAEPATASDAK